MSNSSATGWLVSTGDHLIRWWQRWERHLRALLTTWLSWASFVSAKMLGFTSTQLTPVHLSFARNIAIIWEDWIWPTRSTSIHTSGCWLTLTVLLCGNFLRNQNGRYLRSVQFCSGWRMPTMWSTPSMSILYIWSTTNKVRLQIIG